MLKLQIDYIMQSPRLRFVILLLCCAGAIGGLGCFTGAALSSPNSFARNYYNKPIMTDTVFALAKPDDKLANKIDSKDAIAFLGRKHTYLLVEGGERLVGIARDLNGDALNIETRPGEIFLRDRTIWGNVSLSYAPEPSAAQGLSDTNKLLALGFKRERNGVYRLAIPVKGAMYPAADISEKASSQFKKTRDVSFYRAPDSKPPPDVTKLVKVPLAFAVDVVVIPILVFGLVVIGVTTSGSHW